MAAVKKECASNVSCPFINADDVSGLCLVICDSLKTRKPSSCPRLGDKQERPLVVQYASLKPPLEKSQTLYRLHRIPELLPKYLRVQGGDISGSNVAFTKSSSSRAAAFLTHLCSFKGHKIHVILYW